VAKRSRNYAGRRGRCLAETDRMLRHVEQILMATPEMESFSRRTGAQLGLAIAEPNTGDFLIKLKKDRKRSLDAVTDELRDQIRKAHPALDIEFPHILEDLVSDLASAPQPIEVKIYNRSREEANVYFKVEKVRIGFLTVPSALVNFLLKEHNPLLRKNSAPVTITFGEILIEDGVLKIRG